MVLEAWTSISMKLEKCVVAISQACREVILAQQSWKFLKEKMRMFCEYRFCGPHNRWLYRITLLGPVRGSDAHCFGHARREAGCPAVGGLVRIVFFVSQFRLLVRPEGRDWLMLRRGPLDSGVRLFTGIGYIYQARLWRKPSLAPCRIDR